MISEEFLVRFYPVVLDDKEHPHFASPYSIACRVPSENSLTLQILKPSNAPDEHYEFLRNSAFKQVFTWMKGIDLSKWERMKYFSWNNSFITEHLAKRIRWLTKNRMLALINKFEKIMDEDWFKDGLRTLIHIKWFLRIVESQLTLLYVFCRFTKMKNMLPFPNNIKNFTSL